MGDTSFAIGRLMHVALNTASLLACEQRSKTNVLGVRILYRAQLSKNEILRPLHSPALRNGMSPYIGFVSVRSLSDGLDPCSVLLV